MWRTKSSAAWSLHMENALSWYDFPHMISRFHLFVLRLLVIFSLVLSFPLGLILLHIVTIRIVASSTSVLFECDATIPKRSENQMGSCHFAVRFLSVALCSATTSNDAHVYDYGLFCIHVIYVPSFLSLVLLYRYSP